MASSFVQIETKRGTLELYDETSIDLTLNIKDVREPLGFLYDYSKTITVPATDNNKKIFGFIYEPDQETLFSTEGLNPDFNPKFNIPAKIVIDGFTYKSGSIRIDEVIRDGEDNITEIDVEFVHTLIGLKEKLENTKLHQVDLSEYNHIKSKENIEDSFDQKIVVNGQKVQRDFGEGYVYPLLDYGGRRDKDIWDEFDFRPALYVKELLQRKILEEMGGFQLRSDFFESEHFKRLVIPCVGREDLTDEEKSNRRAAGAVFDHSGLPSDFPANLDIGDVPSLYSKDFITNLSSRNEWLNKKIEKYTDDSNSSKLNSSDKSYDPNEIFDVFSGEYEAPANGKYNINAQIVPQVYLYFPDDDGDYIEITRNEKDIDVNGKFWKYNWPNVKIRVYKEDKNGNSHLIALNEDRYEPNVPVKGQGQSHTTLKSQLDKNYALMKYATDNSFITDPGTIWQESKGIEIDTDVYLNEGEKVYLTVSHNLGDADLPGSPSVTYDVEHTVTGEFGVFDMTLNNISGDKHVSPWEMFVGLKSDWEANFMEVTPVSYQTVGPGGYFEINKGLPDMSCSELIKDVFNMFNLYTIEEEPGVLRIEPFEYMFDIGTVRDWSDRIDRDQETTYTYNTELSRRYVYTYSEGDDYLNERYQDEHNDEVYGQKKIEFNNDRTDDEEELELTFSPSVLDKIGDRTITRILGDENDSDENTNFKRYDSRNGHILYYKKKPSESRWTFRYKDVSDGFKEKDDNKDVIPYAGHLDDPSNPTFDLNFDWVKSIPSYFITRDNLFNRYHAEWILNISDSKSFLMTTNVDLDYEELFELTLNDTIYIDGLTYIINKIEDIDVTNLKDTIEVELLHMPHFDTSQKVFDQVEVTSDGVDNDNGDVGKGYGDTDTINFDDTDGVIGPVLDPTQSTSTTVRLAENTDQVTSYGNINLKGRNNVIKGTETIFTEGIENTITQGDTNELAGPGANHQVQGDRNTIEEESMNINLIGDDNMVGVNNRNIQVIGNDNTIEDGVENAVVISSGSTITGSNQTLIGTKLNVEGETTFDNDVTFNKSISSPGDDQEIIFNSGGTMGGYSGLTFDYNNDTVNLPNININEDPVDDTSVDKFLVREQSTGEIKERDIDSFVTGTTNISPAGENYSVQYNDNGDFMGDVRFRYFPSPNYLAFGYITGTKGNESAVFGGTSSNENKATGNRSVVLGGEGHDIQSGADNSVILGGQNITATDSNKAYIQNGEVTNDLTVRNKAFVKSALSVGPTTSSFGTNTLVAGGSSGNENQASANYSAAIGGENNTAANSSTVILGGNQNSTNGGSGQGIIGSNSSTLSSSHSIMGGTNSSTTSGGQYNAILGGANHTLPNAGGNLTPIFSNNSAIVGGDNNELNGPNRSVILGGQGIQATNNDTVYTPDLEVTSNSNVQGTSTFNGQSTFNDKIINNGGFVHNDEEFLYGDQSAFNWSVNQSSNDKKNDYFAFANTDNINFIKPRRKTKTVFLYFGSSTNIDIQVDFMTLPSSSNPNFARTFWILTESFGDDEYFQLDVTLTNNGNNITSVRNNNGTSTSAPVTHNHAFNNNSTFSRQFSTMQVAIYYDQNNNELRWTRI